MTILTTIGAVICDVTLSSTWPGESEVTPYPVEVGTDPTDSSRPLPRRWQGEVKFSNTPLNREQVNRANGVMGLVSDGVPEIVEGYAEEQYARLDRYRNDRVVVRIVTRDRTLESALLTSVTPSRDSTTGNAIQLSISAIEYVVVKNRFTTIQIARPASAIARPKQRVGKVVVEPVDAGVSDIGGVPAQSAAAAEDARKRPLYRADSARDKLNRKRAISGVATGM